MFVSEINELIALVKIAPYSLDVLGIAVADEAKENPLPKGSRNIAFPSWVILLGLSTKVIWVVKDLGPSPATFIYWADLPGAPTAINKGYWLRLSALVYPSFP